MNELRVAADRDDLGPEFPEVFIPLCQSGKLRGSDKGEISGVEEEDCPLPVVLQCGEAYLSKVSFRRFIRFQFKIRHRRANVAS
jgi:hypothetical protein